MFRFLYLVRLHEFTADPSIYPKQFLHQQFSQDWASLNKEAVEASGRSGDILYWMRSGGRNSKYNLGMSWAGDQNVDWSRSDGLKSSIIAALSLALSGGVGVSHR